MDFRWLIRSYFSSVHFSLLLNGSIGGSFSPERGLRQGDPLSPILIILCSEILSRVLSKEEEQDRLHGIKAARNIPAISHLMYADDLLIMCQVDSLEAAVVNECLNKFCSWSGQALNMEKSSIFFSKTTKHQDKKLIREVLSFKDMGSKAIYLGNSLVFGNNKTKEFYNLKEKIKSRLEG